MGGNLNDLSASIKYAASIVKHSLCVFSFFAPPNGIYQGWDLSPIYFFSSCLYRSGDSFFNVAVSKYIRNPKEGMKKKKTHTLFQPEALIAPHQGWEGIINIKRWKKKLSWCTSVSLMFACCEHTGGYCSFSLFCFLFIWKHYNVKYSSRAFVETFFFFFLLFQEKYLPKLFIFFSNASWN